MRTLPSLATGLFLSVILVAMAHAAQVNLPENQQGEQAMTSGTNTAKAWQDREAQRREIKKKAAAMRQQLLMKDLKQQDQQVEQ